VAGREIAVSDEALVRLVGNAAEHAADGLEDRGGFVRGDIVADDDLVAARRGVFEKRDHRRDRVFDMFEGRDDDGGLDRPAVVCRLRQQLHSLDMGGQQLASGLACRRAELLDDIEISEDSFGRVGAELFPQEMTEAAAGLFGRCRRRRGILGGSGGGAVGVVVFDRRVAWVDRW
jgi:hypothetical protein